MVEKNTVSTKLQLRLKTGLNEEGKEIVRTKTYSNVKASAEDQEVYDVATILSGLQEHDLKEVHRVDDVVLINI